MNSSTLKDVDCIYLTAWKLDGLTANLKKDELAIRISNTNFLTDAFELEATRSWRT
ncbi:hypothetical protein EST38_g14521 [Candolleomyces aberdarensis]|uniref:Uncharacterized protein n=1 Tax=Candolleomyces aberdarensis TaxID=2316362 RepID=A0A4Q2CX57_9AGAR|nr:hypothetical protein EST38_g14521 [Candolleomyces aberdarensis]